MEAKGFSQLPADSSIGQLKRVTYAVILYNPNPPDASTVWAAEVHLNVTFTGASGNVVGSDNPGPFGPCCGIGVILPGQKVAVSGSVDLEAADAKDMSVQTSVEEWMHLQGPVPGAFSTSGVTTTPSTTYPAEGKTLGTVHSTFPSEYKQVSAVAVYEGSAGQVLGGASELLDFVPANGTVGFTITTSSLPPGIKKTVAYARLSRLT